MNINKDTNYAVSFIGGYIKVREKPDSCLWCLDSNYQLCVIVLPEPSYKLIDSIVTEYSVNNHVATTVGCIDLYSENPVFFPAAMSLDTYTDLFNPISEFIKNKLPPPKDLAEMFLENVNFTEQDTTTKFVKLNRQANNLKKGDLFSTDKEGKRIEIYVTYSQITDKPYSIKELYKFKLKNLFKFW